MEARTKWVIAGGSVITLALVVGGVWWLRSQSLVGVRGTTPVTPGGNASPATGTAAAPSPNLDANVRAQEELLKNLPPDADSDGIPDEAEARFKTDPNKADTDGDGFSDWDEINTMKTDPTKPDPLTASGRPIIAPAAPSTATVPATPTTPIVATDTDGDGLSDTDEAARVTDPNKPDTDGDGLTDGDEVNKFKTDPRLADSDNDGYTDGDEVKNGYNPLGAGRCPTPGCLL